MSVVDIKAGGMITLDPSDKRTVNFSWDDSLGASATITDSVYTIAVDKQNGATILTKDNPSIAVGSRATLVRLLATTATLGDKYRVSNKITTNETPAQEKEQSYSVVIQNR